MITKHNTRCETISVDEAAKRLGIGRVLAYRLAAAGEIPALRLGKRLVVPVVQLEALIAGGERDGREST
ncbi:MAG: helix-turn-helix domain-containing protein [Gaiellaceae bacterium]|jgi:excisionase family DNA binding protein